MEINESRGSMPRAVDEAASKLADATVRAAEALDAKGRQLRDMQLQVADRCRARLNDKPLATLGIAVAAGFMLNWLVKQRPMSRQPGK